jgi:hypothetical protein
MGVFVSYSSRDKDAVIRLTQDLQDADEQVWLDQRLAGSQPNGSGQSGGRRRCLPCPAGQFLEPTFAIGAKSALVVPLTLTTDPPTEPVAIDGIGLRDAGVAVAFDVVEELTELLLPFVGVGIPCPAGQLLKPVLMVGVEGAFAPLDALLVDPRTEPTIVGYVAGRDAGVAVVFDVVQELAECLLPLGGI